MSLRSRVKRLAKALPVPSGVRCKTCRGPVPWDDSRWLRYVLIAPNGVVIFQEDRCSDCGQVTHRGRGEGEPSASGENVMGSVYVAYDHDLPRWNCMLPAWVRRAGLNYDGPEGRNVPEPVWLPEWTGVPKGTRDAGRLEEAAIPGGEFGRQFDAWCREAPYITGDFDEEVG
jgi:hypothetical protein